MPAAVLNEKEWGVRGGYDLPVFSTAFGTSSSLATLPVAMQAADNLKSEL